ncbi:MAG: SDR family oxidoreductase [Oscillospiraceae bacterium]|nr:SDR family oxidoreductase [Oscillospiraceae bacterium]
MARTILIVGGTGDLGLALAQAMYAAGDTLILQGIGDLSTAQAFAARCPGTHVLACDLTDEAAVAAFIEQVKAIGMPDHLVHLPALPVVNAKFKNFDEERFERDFAVQVRSALRICKAFVPVMAKAKYGRVLFVLTSYIMGVPPKNVTAYVTSKGALEAMARSLAIEYAANGVTVNCVAPSMIETGFLADTSSLIVEAAAKANPMGRNATVADVVPAMCFLLSEEARYITGATLPITGGSQM